MFEELWRPNPSPCVTPITIETENHTKFYDQLLSISDICWLISIDIYGGC